MAVTGTVQVAVSLTNLGAGDSTGKQSNTINVGASPVTISDGASANQFSKIYRKVISLTAATPQTLDLTALTDDGGASVSFSTIKEIYMRSKSTTSSHKVTVGAAASNAFTGPLAGTSPTLDVCASSPVNLCNLLSSGWTVDATHKSLKLDPGANTQDFELVLAGT